MQMSSLPPKRRKLFHDKISENFPSNNSVSCKPSGWLMVLCNFNDEKEVYERHTLESFEKSFARPFWVYVCGSVEWMNWVESGKERFEKYANMWLEERRQFK